MNLPTVSTSHSYTYGGCPTAWIFEKIPITEEEARGYMNAFTSLSKNDWALERRRRLKKAYIVRQYPKFLDYSANAMT
eukprot:4730389-Pyramimonas_sp.AAC.1